jgi:endonuclease III-like uncharacterized protein
MLCSFISYLASKLAKLIECSGFEKKKFQKIAKFEKSLIKFLIFRKTTEYFFEKFSNPEATL